MTPHTNTLMDLTGQNAPVDGAWFAVKNDGRSYRAVNISLTAGTATVVLEGRMGPNDTGAEINNVTASTGFLAGHFPQYRVRLTAATGASVRVTVDGVLLQVA